MQKPLLLLSTILILLSISCNRNSYSADNLADQYIVVGSGGGFTGAVTEKMIMENGQVFERKDEIISPANKISKKAAKSIFNTYHNAAMDSITYHQPSNYYYYLGKKNNDKKHVILWCDGHPADSTVLALYKEIQEALLPKK